jgi:hypothetical protein
MNMRERMARAMHAALYSWESLSPRQQADYLAMADAALSALAEPTEAMVDAAWAAFKANGTAKEIFRAMIGATGEG